ncbi:MAG: tRNA (adenosine(37)-N6)-threonylcarbamoyltransferase complex ATPase subunit type 1 TsaE [Candidatus Magasanikbacteria bacterium RIFCSPLOWO2_01_FULL_43_20b]|uniref:tRNA threonylcarbamoyladenosine biosynthesis protein TsaE n=1 Tax=Candidatus Magasanikbacteria bacterium RIFCSPLOWO2_12_FULL_43_12 TaxID=1798692 RepID=A0A1F6MS20_9BACT|nr:MAG: tRNA (adenosine(37)-N6)-threonylcarbamoyltransferase complex ATPase subunit type 1 TsaE [Candidatus Magasanikbacteria bacterium RIFCSPHIGHO2_02_FULL_44_13]OGH72070.1 MAG: tRNA (adenosine(37)-N6)-threonylcarbamoyltransferase complex ATPase subunit type 1 TsaE [Candidatus Magasanikbacteria bacterium RIFCSPLOWO2_02_FULL_43_22]OGH73431.1 MAG: tRNA (adenosine(37)-N6)-threonylcarbamoyltransferase complex ATPase subunit type 1 TsaE [Candidatus Magasanikbacteria bacterium RIFCSPLOWO2_01_FULL_43_2
MRISSEQQMIGFGKKIAAELKGGDVVLLYGELGAGKTTLTKGIAARLGIKKNIVSPTFTLMQVYKISNIKYQISNLVHIDTYRLKDEKQLYEIGAEDYIGDSETVCVIEWPEKLGGLLEGKRVKKVFIEVEGGGRKVEIN